MEVRLEGISLSSYRLEESLRKLRKREIMNDILPFDILADN